MAKKTKRKPAGSRRKQIDRRTQAQRDHDRMLHDLWFKSRWEWLNGLRPMSPALTVTLSSPPTAPPSPPPPSTPPNTPEPALPIDRAKAVLHDLDIPKGLKSLAATTKRVKEECEKRDWRTVERDTVARATGRRKK